MINLTCFNSAQYDLIMVPVLLRRIFVFATILCVLVPISWLLLRRDPLEANADFTIQRQPIINQFQPPKRTERRAKPVDPGVLIVYKHKSNLNFRNVKTFFQALRIEHDVYAISKTSHVPRLIRTTPVAQQSIGRYRFIVVVGVSDYVNEDSVRGLFTEYCQIFDAVLIILTNGNDRWFNWNTSKPHNLFEDDINMAKLPQSTLVHHLKVHEGNNFVYVRDGGRWTLHDRNTLVTFWPHRTSISGNLFPFMSDAMKTRFQVLASVYYSSVSNHKLASLPVAMVDWSSNDNVQRVFIGIPMSSALTKLLLLEVLNMFSHNHQILRTGTSRSIQIDIDDIFVAPQGSKLTEEDVKVRFDC